LYQELSFQEASILEDSSEITGNWVNPGEFASSGINSNSFAHFVFGIWLHNFLSSGCLAVDLFVFFIF